MKLNRNQSIIALIACAMACGNLAAQETDFDLASQRSEVQSVLPVTGKKLDHQGIIINPTPHQISVDRTNVWDVSGGFALKDKQKKFAGDFGFTTIAKKCRLRRKRSVLWHSDLAPAGGKSGCEGWRAALHVCQ